jgi:hypothetical protein
MYTVHADRRECGPFGNYQNALAYARSHWKEKEFHITGPHSDDVPV